MSEPIVSDNINLERNLLYDIELDCLRSLLRRVILYYTASVWNTSKLLLILIFPRNMIFDLGQLVIDNLGQLLLDRWVR